MRTGHETDRSWQKDQRRKRGIRSLGTARASIDSRRVTRQNDGEEAIHRMESGVLNPEEIERLSTQL